MYFDKNVIHKYNIRQRGNAVGWHVLSYLLFYIALSGLNTVFQIKLPGQLVAIGPIPFWNTTEEHKKCAH